MPTSLAAFFGAGYWLSEKINSGTEKIQQAQVKFLESQLSLTRQSAVKANVAVVDAKKEADLLRAPDEDGDPDRLDDLLSTAASESKVVVILLHMSDSLATSIATGKEMKVPALEYQPRFSIDDLMRERELEEKKIEEMKERKSQLSVSADLHNEKY